MAARWFQAPVAVIRLAEDRPGWLRACYGPHGGWSADELAILANAFPEDRAEAIADAAADPALLYSVLVSGPRRLRFCASAPLIDADGNRLGALLVASNRPRNLRQDRLEGLAGLARVAALALRQWESTVAVTESRFSDPSERRRAETLFEHAADFVFTQDLRGRITSVNRAAAELTGYSRQELLAMEFADLVDPPDREAASQMVLAQYGGGQPGPMELSLAGRDGKRIDAEVRAYLLFERGVPSGLMGFVRPLRRPPDPRSHDAVTGLLNARGVARQLQSEIDACRRRAEPVAAMLIEVGGLRLVNEALGYHAGDQLIEALAERFRDCLSPGQWLGRLGGKRFVVVSRGADRAQAEALARQLLERTNPALKWEDDSVFLTASIGVSRFPEDGADALSLMRNAESALNRALCGGTGAVGFYSPDLPCGAVARLELATSLRKAIENGELRQLFQPQSDAGGRLAGLEALLAWDHPRFGRLPAHDFISVAEESGLIARIDAWMLGEACRRSRLWQQAGHGRVRIAVNVSGAEFERPDFIDLVIGAFQASGLDPRWLELEITESVLMRDVAESARRIERLRELGVALAIDDFGTGYSSLSYLRKLRVDAVKIDKSFVEGIDQTSGGLSLVESIIAMVHGLGLAVVAEGVETPAQWEVLRRAGCDRMQGHLLGTPLEEADAVRLLDDPHPFPVG
jgi:diguanylate cyclase (GGDEF)-like protein/PAS domain S-box-containing protein